MYAALLVAVLSLPGQCPDCAQAGQGANTGVGPNCTHYTAPVRWFCRRCAGCAGGTCESCSQPYFGSRPYNYRLQFDYPWSQRPSYPIAAVPLDGEHEIWELPEEVRKKSKPAQHELASRLNRAVSTTASKTKR